MVRVDKWLFVFLLPLVWLAPARASANLRAPRVVQRTASSLLATPQLPEVVVLREDLSFDCDSEACRVAARYDVRAAEAVDAALAFVLPVDADVSVMVGDKPVPATVAPDGAAPFRGRERSRLFNGWRAEPGYVATFRATLPAGDFSILVRYRHQWGLSEHGYGYFSDGDIVKELFYEVWPLREWTLAPGFFINVQLSAPYRKPGWWRRWFGTVNGFACEVGTFERGTQPPAAHSYLAAHKDEGEGRFVINARVLPPIPDRIFCAYGNEDLIPARRD